MRKKVVFIVKYFYPIKRPSGISSFVYELACELAGEVDLSVISAGKAGDENYYEHQGFKIYKVKRNFPFFAPRLAKSLNPDVVFIFSGIYKPALTMLYFGLISFILRKKKKVFCQATNYNKNLKSWFKPFLNRFHSVISTNDWMQENYEKLGVKSVLIPPGVRVSEVVPAAKNKPFRVGFIGHFYRIKGADRLLKAFLKIDPKNAELVFAGGEGELKEMIKSTRDPRIIVFDWQDHILPIIASCDLLVLPYRESFSVLGVAQSALEAMSLKIPVIGTKTPSLEFLIKSGYNGYIIQDDKDLEDKLRYLFANPEKAVELGNNAYQTILDNYSIQKIKNKYLEIVYGE